MVTVVVGVASLLLWSTTSDAQSVSGYASAVQATVLGTTTALSHTGTLVDANDAREASQLTGSIPSLLQAEVLHATAISSVQGSDASGAVGSEASLANLGLTVAGNAIAAEFVMARALAPVGAVPVGVPAVEGLSVDGVPIWVTGEPNQTISLPGATIVLNEVRTSASGITVTALKVTSIDGLTDVAVATAVAGVTSVESATVSEPATTLLGQTVPLSP
ncbi:MAG TPA: choice-of-anchor P family protein [Candidatus Methylomirabilis sp.]|nr:choice-of-anchor P family protein [Candidatus Methylomirabilis sp.]